MSTKTRILIADDQRLFADGLKTIIDTRASDMEVVAVARDGAEAVSLARSRKPHVILMDVCMPDMDGVEAVRVIHQESPEIAIIMLTTFDDDDYVLDALRNGAMGYLLKDMPLDELIATVRGIRSGAVVISPAVAGNLVRSLEQAKSGTAGDSAPHWLDSLSRRERQVLRLVAEGRNNFDIGSTLGIGEQTVKNYVSAIYDKIGMHDRLRVMREAERYSRFLAGD